MNDNILMENAIAFAAKAIKLREQLLKEKGENLISFKLAECAADIGAEISGAAYSRSREMHLAAHYEALSMASQCEYWIKLLCTAEYIDNKAHSNHGRTIYNSHHCQTAVFNLPYDQNTAEINHLHKKFHQADIGRSLQCE